MISNQITKLSRSILAKRSIYYHGTSKDNLRSILKEGLLPAGWKGLKLNFDNESPYSGYSTKTFGGVYLTKNLSQAKVYSNMGMIVEVSVESNSPGVLLDEDILNRFFDEIGFGKHLIDDLNDKFDFKLGKLNQELLDQIIKYIQTANLDQIINKILDSMKTDFHLDLLRDINKKKQDLDQLLRDEMLHLLESEYNKQFELDQINFPKPEELKATYKSWKNSVDQFLKLFPKTTSESRKIRFPYPITYRGKNKITGIMVFGKVIRNQELDLYGRIIHWVYGDDSLVNTYCKTNNSDVIFIYKNNHLVKVMLSGKPVNKKKYISIFRERLEQLNLI